MRNIKVEHTGEYPNKCSGKWIITVDGLKVTLKNFDSHMNTAGTYQGFNYNSSTSDFDWHDYDDGLDFEDWVRSDECKAVLNALGDIDFTEDEMKQLYDQINYVDWRHGQCGGCM